MKKHIAAAVCVGLSALVVSAHAPSIAIDPIPDMSFGVFPQVYAVTGTATHNPVSVLQNVSLRVNGVVVASSSAPFVGVVGTTSPFLLPWEILGPGTYAVAVTARHGATGQTGTSTEETVIIEQTVVVGECPAAPAIAGAYLRERGVKPSSPGFRAVVQRVAQETGIDGVLWAKHACDASYPHQVRAYVDAL